MKPNSKGCSLSLKFCLKSEIGWTKTCDGRSYPERKVLATVVRLLEVSLIRIGNEEYAKENRSFGLTTMRNRHAEIEGATVRFQFRGKSGKKHQVEVSDRRVARILQKCQDLPGQHLFEYLDSAGQVAPDRI